MQCALHQLGITCFVGHNDIKPTTEWQNQIVLGLKTCDVLVAFLLEGFHNSNSTDQEIGFAMGGAVQVCSVRLGADPHGFSGRYPGFPNIRSTTRLAKTLFDHCVTDAETSDRMTEICVKPFEQSASFEEAKMRIGYLEETKMWPPQLLVRIESAVANNIQIREAWGVEMRVRALLERSRNTSSR